ncbi:Lrp/AsnC family transcriptional regulator [Telmatospirillum sp.]|uniref:Lrp/AsnC family transcriptional regulator n=1 Tax=Telmatospirillum sp. TaxID=2079197 RepID=UPI002847D926|nr:Lrp/AsnC family transcriptional regulator [Telmatospirillum sp.]MDR3439793.1 Lrp/AsnC family transcriptional regulator [Telmatospirillum sp.]
MKLDTKDRAILKLLQANAGQSNVELADRVGLSPSACLRRVQLLEEAGIIEGSALLLNPVAMGFSGNAFVQVTLDQQGRQTLDRFEAAVTEVPEVLSCYLLAGQADYFLHVVYRDSVDLERIHTDILTRLPGVIRVQSILSLRTVKRGIALPI